MWVRHPATSIKRRPEIDFDEFVADFARMNVREEPRTCVMKRKSDDLRNSSMPKWMQISAPRAGRSAATLFITTRPLPAPLPSLIRSTVSTSRLPLPPVLTPSLHDASRLPTTPPGPDMSQRAASVILPENAIKRRIAPLPRSAQATTGRIHRGAPSVVPDGSPPASPPPLSTSRTSSFGSNHSSCSVSSGGSSASSVVATPESSPTSLPTHLAQSPTMPEFCALPDMDNAFKISPTTYLSPGGGFQSDFSSTGFYLGAGEDTNAPFGTLSTPISGQ
jgi:hypothetical protein